MLGKVPLACSSVSCFSNSLGMRPASSVGIGCPFHYHGYCGCAVCFPFLVLYDTTTSGGNTHVHIAAAPQIVLLYKCVCFACAGAHAKHTHLYYNVWSPQATLLYSVT